MNKSRRMITLQATRLAEQGIAVLVLDLYGTGDSAGEFQDATWERWLEDLDCAIDYLRHHGNSRITLWGLRTGCLLAYAYLRSRLRGVDRLLFWQPNTNGQLFLKQFLRLRVAAAMMNGEKISPNFLREQIASGEPVEIAGYLLTAELIDGLESVGFSSGALPTGVPVNWLEVSSSAEGSLSPASSRIVERWETDGCEVIAQTVAGEAFWTSQEIVTNPALLDATSRLFYG